MRRLGDCHIKAWPVFEWRSLDGDKGVEHAMIIGAPWAQDTIDKLIEEHYPGKSQGITLVALMTPGQVIAEHVDSGTKNDGNCCARVHVPLVTDPACVFVTEGQEHHMPVGGVYVVDPTIPHGVIHRGTKRRIHLMFNVN